MAIRLDPSRPAAVPSSPARYAVRATLPLSLSVAPFGAALGVTMAEAEVPTTAGLTLTAVLYAGSAQLATLAALLGGGSLLTAVVMGAVVNARLLLYSAALGDRFRTSQPRWFRWLGPATLIDQTVVLARRTTELSPHAFRRAWLVSGCVLGVVWVGSVGLGAQLAGRLQASDALRVAAPAVLLALVVGSLDVRRHRRAVVVAAAVAAVSAPLAAGLGTTLAIAAGVLAAGRASEVAS